MLKQLAEQGRLDDAYAAPLAKFAIGRYREGRHGGVSSCSTDVMGEHCILLGRSVVKNYGLATNVADTFQSESAAADARYQAAFRCGCTRRILVPISRSEMIEETRLFFDWYNEHRPHMTLRGKTPNEVYFGRHAANAKPRIETRSLAKHKTPCASPRMCIAGKAGAKVRVRIEFLGDRMHLPILKVERI